MSTTRPMPARLTPEQLKKIQSAKGGSFGKVERVQIPKDGEVTGYILPGEWGKEKFWYLAVGTHYIEEVAKYPLNCPRINLDEEGGCPLCEIHFAYKKEYVKPLATKIEKMKAAGATKEELSALQEEHDIHDDYAGKFRAKTAFATNFLIKGETKPKLFEIPNKAFTTIFQTWQSSATQHAIDMFDPNCCYSVTIKKTGSGLTTTYTATLAPVGEPIIPSRQDPGLLDKQAFDELMGKTVNLSEHYGKIERELLAKAATVLQSAGDEAAHEAPAPETKVATAAPVTGVKMDDERLRRLQGIAPKTDEDVPTDEAPTPVDVGIEKIAPVSQTPAEKPAPTSAGSRPNPFASKLQRMGATTP